jgi:hypothetical protein
MKGFSIGVTTVYITEDITPFLGECDIADPRYIPTLVP